MVMNDFDLVMTYNATVFVSPPKVTAGEISAISEVMNRLLVQRSLLSLVLHLPSLLSGM